VWHVADAIRLGLSNDDLFALTKIDPWFLEQIRDLMQFEALLVGQGGKKSLRLRSRFCGRPRSLAFQMIVSRSSSA
jgi:Carbamoyl-phosphate synthetase large chain, oligomerisation domain.